MKLKDTHRSIIGHLRADARKSFTEISSKTGIPITTIFDNYQKLCDEGVILKHAMMIDFHKLGCNYRNFIFVKPKDTDSFKEFISSRNCVNSLYSVNGYDFLIDAVFPTIREFYYFMDELKRSGVSKVETHDVIESLKLEDFFAIK